MVNSHMLIIMIIILLLVPASSFAGDDEKNFMAHAGISAIFGAVSETYLHYNTKLGATERIIYGTVIGSVPGLAKEVIDSTRENNHFSGTQMLGNVIGSFLGSVIANLVNERLQMNIEKQKEKTTISLTYRF